MKCYNWLVWYQNALRKVEEISFEIQKDYQSDDLVHVKRLAKEPGRLPEAKKSLKFGDTSSAMATCENSQHSQVQDFSPAALAAALTPRIVVTSFARPPVFSFGSVSPIHGIQNSGLIQKALHDSRMQQQQEVSVTEMRETQVHISVTYQCGKTFRKELKNDLSFTGEAIVHGPLQRIASAVLATS